jgi:hypothetical protein
MEKDDQIKTMPIENFESEEGGWKIANYLNMMVCWLSIY